MGLSNYLPFKKIPWHIKAAFFLSLCFLMAANFLSSGMVTMQQLIGPEYTVAAQYGITPLILIGILDLLFFLLLVFGIYRMVYPKAPKPTIQKDVSTLKATIMNWLRLIFVIAGLVNIYIYAHGGSSYNLYAGGGSMSLGALLDQIVHIFSSSGGVFNNIKSIFFR